MMQAIDFLPASYHKRLHKRRLRARKTWISVGLTVLIVGWTGLELFSLQNKSRNVTQLEERVQEEAAVVEERHALNRRKAHLNARIRLHDDLRLPVDYATVGAAIAQAMPPSVGLDRLEMVHEGFNPEQAKTSRTPQARKPKAAPQAIAPPVEQLIVYVQGFGPDDGRIQDFVSALQDKPMFSEVVFRSIRDEEVDDLVVRSFNLVLTVDLNRRFVNSQEVAHVD